MLDLMAVFTGRKRSALVLPADLAGSQWPAIGSILPPHESRILRHWVVKEEIAGLPDWYAAELRASRQNASVRLVWKPAAATRDVAPTSAAAEADLLSYPRCCVRAYYRRRRLYHRFMVKRVRQFAGTDEVKARDLVAAEVTYAPATAGERTAFAVATAFVLAPFTTLAMCPSCAASADSPARRISAAYQGLAADAGLTDLLSADAGILSARN